MSLSTRHCGADRTVADKPLQADDVGWSQNMSGSETLARVVRGSEVSHTVSPPSTHA